MATNDGVAPVAVEPEPLSAELVYEDLVTAEPLYEDPVVKDEPVTEALVPVAVISATPTCAFHQDRRTSTATTSTV